MRIGNFDLTNDGVYIIAELSANHGGKIEIAKETIKATKEIGANAIKLQTYTADTLTLDSDNEDFIIKGGDIITEKNVRSVRPGYGLHPKFINDILGKTVNKKLEKGESMRFDSVGKDKNE